MLAEASHHVFDKANKFRLCVYFADENQEIENIISDQMLKNIDINLVLRVHQVPAPFLIEKKIITEQSFLMLQQSELCWIDDIDVWLNWPTNYVKKISKTLPQPYFMDLAESVIT